MTLSKREQEILRRLEREFEGGKPLWRRLRSLRLSRWSDWIGGAFLAAGAALVLILLQTSVVASFAAFAVAMLGLALLLTGPLAGRVASAVRRARAGERNGRRPPDVELDP